MNTIMVQNLEKTYSYYKKDQGLRSSLKNLLHRETLYKNAVKKISFAIEEGEIVGFLGPNGAGKTTTLKMLSGILYPTGGKALVSGYIPWERKNEFKRKIAIVLGQKGQLWWDLPAIDSLYLNKCIYGIDDKAYHSIVGELTELLDVKEQLKVQARRLSLGERMKLELIAALIHNPKVLFLDEPTIGLDLISQQKIREFIRSYNQKFKTTILLTSHYMSDIVALCQRTIVINNGDLVYDGILKDVNRMFRDQKVVKVQLNTPEHKEKFEPYGEVRSVDDYSVTISVRREHVSKVSNDIFNRFDVLDLNIEDIPIEEGIALLYRSGGDQREAIE